MIWFISYINTSFSVMYWFKFIYKQYRSDSFVNICYENIQTKLFTQWCLYIYWFSLQILYFWSGYKVIIFWHQLYCWFFKGWCYLTMDYSIFRNQIFDSTDCISFIKRLCNYMSFTNSNYSLDVNVIVSSKDYSSLYFILKESSGLFFMISWFL